MCKHEGIYIYIYIMRKSADHAKHAASLSHSQSHENTPGQDGEERENGVAKHVIRPGQSGDEGPTTPTDPDKARTRPQNCLGNKGRTQKDKPARPEAARRTRGGPRFTSARGQLQRSATGYAHRVYQFYCAAQLYNATVLHLSHNWYQECDMLHKGIVIL